jgi:hypothetical protein
MMGGRWRIWSLAARFSAVFLPILWSVGVDAQEQLHAYRQVAYESGHGTTVIKRGPGRYVLRVESARSVYLDVFVCQ